MDCISLPHTLDGEAQPDVVLRECIRVLAPEGHLIIVGFNPHSLLGCQKLLRFKAAPPSQGRWYSPAKIKSFLLREDCDVLHMSTHYFRPLMASPIWRERLAFMQSMGQMLAPSSGGFYFILARKKSAHIIPIKEKRGFFQKRLGKRVTSNIGHNRNGK